MRTGEFPAEAVEPSTDRPSLFDRGRQLFGDRLEIEGLVSASNDRALLLARDPVLKRRVALRVYFAPDATGRAWFTQESELFAMLDHPGVRTVYAAGEQGDWVYRLGKWVEGENLDAAVRRGPRPIPEVLGIARDIIGAVEYAHAKGIVLRRLVPSSVMLDEKGRAIITDLRGANRQLTLAEVADDLEAAPFMAPEAEHGGAAEPAGDIYAVGAILYFAVTGLPPDADPHRIVTPVQCRPTCPKVLERVILRALQPDPSKRYLNAADMWHDLATYLGDTEPPAASPPGGGSSDDPEAWERRLRRVLGDEYELLEELGIGGFGSVYRVRDLRLERDVALKVLHPQLTRDPEVVERFRHEAQVAAQLDHPNIVRIYNTGGRGGLIWYTMAYVAGVSLAQVVRLRGPFPLLQIMVLMDEALDALSHAHDHGVVHRDLKPENILLDAKDGSVRITDFGLAMALHRDRFGGASSHSGTPEYAAPEQLLGEPVDHRADLYALSMVAVYALSGKPPFGGGTTESVLARQVAGGVPDVAWLRGEVPNSVLEVIRRGAARNPGDRYASAADYAVALRRSMRRRPVGFGAWVRSVLGRLAR